MIKIDDIEEFKRMVEGAAAELGRLEELLKRQSKKERSLSIEEIMGGSESDENNILSFCKHKTSHHSKDTAHISSKPVSHLMLFNQIHKELSLLRQKDE